MVLAYLRIGEGSGCQNIEQGVAVIALCGIGHNVAHRREKSIISFFLQRPSVDKAYTLGDLSTQATGFMGKRQHRMRLSPDVYWLEAEAPSEVRVSSGVALFVAKHGQGQG